MPRPLARVLGLLEILQTGGTHRLADLSVRLGVDERTARRYAAHLLDLGIPVETVRGRYGGYRLGAGYRLPPLLLTDDEALAVVLGLATGPNDLAGSSALAKILRVLPATSRSRFEALVGAAAFAAAVTPGPATDTGILLSVAEAAGARTPLRVRYVDRGERASHRLLLPLGLVARGGRWYLSASDSLSGEVRTFRVDRMREAVAQEGSFSVPPGFDAADSVRASLAGTPWRHAVSVRVEATVEYALASMPEGLATVVDLGPREEGWVRVELRAERLDWVPALLVGLDRQFIVDAPVELRDRMRFLAERLAAAASGGERADS